MNQDYDVIVIGGGVAGAFRAAGQSKAGVYRGRPGLYA